MDLEELEFDEGKVDGIWVQYDDAEFLIRSSTAREYQRAVQRISRKFPAHKVRKDSETQVEIAVEAAADALLLDFRNVNEAGKPLKNTRENRLKIMRNPILRDWIADQSTDLANFQAGGEAEDASDLKSGA